MQVLIDEERYAQLEHESRRTGRSVAAIVREAIDQRFDADLARRAAAGRRLVAEFTDEERDEPDWAVSKEALAADLETRLE